MATTRGCELVWLPWYNVSVCAWASSSATYRQTMSRSSAELAVEVPRAEEDLEVLLEVEKIPPGWEVF